MSGCMGTDKPLISILMAVYEPHMDWLKEQLDSLNAQTYPNLRLYLRDDCSPDVPFSEIQMMVERCITRFPYQIERNEQNLGSNVTFERLTREAGGEYFAYCDQDDIWLPEKVEVLFNASKSRHATLACSDVMVIDADGKQIANSIVQLRPRHIFYSGDHLEDKLLYHNFVIGCTMLLPSDLAKQACPFMRHMVHDHYLALYATLHGSIYSHPEPLIQYRIHGGNQTGVLSAITCKKDYVDLYLGGFVRRIRELAQRLSFPALTLAQSWAEARMANSTGSVSGACQLWRLRAIDRPTSYFELVALRFPDFLFRLTVRIIRKGKL